MSHTRGPILAIPGNDRDHVTGPDSATITVVNYGDYQCPDCHRRHREVQRMVDELQRSVRFVYRHFPLVKVHPLALRTAEAAEAAGAQGKFWEMHRQLYTNPHKLEDRNLRHYAREIGLDLERYDDEMANSSYAAQILKDYYNAIIYGISGAPTTFINDELCALTGVDLFTTVKSILQKNSASPRTSTTLD